ncbi:hypothetical protein [Lacipirellula limnantheis]|nr:hypothetical protein [Lacipirellula limnantheis]
MSGQRHSSCTRYEERLRGLRYTSGVSGGTLNTADQWATIAKAVRK